MAIVSCLDIETARIDLLLAEKAALSKVLTELRCATVAAAIAGNRSVRPRKKTGIREFPDIPEHWQVAALKRFVDVTDCKHVTVPFLDDGPPVVSIREVRNGIVDLTEAKRTDESHWQFLRENRTPAKGDLIFVRNASVGAVGVVRDDVPFAMGQDVCLISGAPVGKYLWYVLASHPVQSQLESLLLGSTIRRVNVEQIRNFLVCWPPVAEQREIAAALDRECGEIDDLLEHVEREITLLRELRAATITDVVLGRIDIRTYTKKSSATEAAT